MIERNIWESTLLDPDDSVEQAVNVLETTSLRIVLVVDKNRVLLGTVTDGDIRRGLIQHLPMTSEVSQVMNSQPLSTSKDASRESILSLMNRHDVLQLPILDKKGIVVGLEVMQELLQVQVVENSVLIMAGGFGSRLRPLTDTVPKPMLKIMGKPILESILNQFVEQGFQKIYISVHYKKEIIKNHFRDGSAWGVDIEYLEEQSPLGTAGALALLPVNQQRLPVLVMNGDLLTSVNFKELLNYHKSTQSLGCVCVRPYDVEVRYGVVESVGHRITRLVEKPLHKYFVNAGIYVIGWELIDRINSGEKIDMTDLLKQSIQKNEVVTMYPIHENWLDIGVLEQYNEANSLTSADNIV